MASAPRGSIPATPSSHRLQRGLPGYLILFATHAFASQRQYLPREPPSPLVFLPISTNFTSTPGIPLSSSVLKLRSIKCTSGVGPRAFTPDLRNRLRALRPVIPSNVCTLCLTAAAGTELAGACCKDTVRARACSTRTGSSLSTGLYNPKAFVAHAASLRQTFVHCARFPTAASRRSLDRVSVPVWLAILSDQLPVLALVSRYLTN